MNSTISDPKFTIYVRDFTSTPDPRMIQDGPHSGEEFRDKHLLPKFQKAGLFQILLKLPFCGW